MESAISNEWNERPFPLVEASSTNHTQETPWEAIQ